MPLSRCVPEPDFSLSKLPAEIITLIADHLPVRDALALAATNHAYYELLDQRAWKHQVNYEELHLGPLWWAVTRRACTVDTLAVARRALSLGAAANGSILQDASMSEHVDHYRATGYIWTTPLLQAIWSDYLYRAETSELIRKPVSREMVQLLLEFGADPIKDHWAVTAPLQLAIESNNVELVELFLSSPPPPTRDVSDDWDERAWRANSRCIQNVRKITVASRSGVDARIVQLLLDAGAAIVDEDDGSTSDTPLYTALEHGNHDAGPDMTAALGDGGAPWAVWEKLIVQASRCTRREYEVDDPKRPAGAAEYIEILEKMLAQYQRPTTPRDVFLDGKSRQTCWDMPWTNWVLSARFQISTIVLQMLLAAGFQIGANVASKVVYDYSLWNIKDDLLYQDTISTVKLLLELGVDPNYVDRETGMTPLLCAARKAKPQLVEVLLSHGADVTVRDKYGIPVLTRSLLAMPLFIFCQGSASDRVARIVRSLLKHDGCHFEDGSPSSEMRAQMEFKATGFGYSALMIAIRKHRMEAVELLIDAGADVNTTDKDGMSPAELADRFENTRYLVPILLMKQMGVQSDASLMEL